MANEICNKLDQLEGKTKTVCNNKCDYFKFPHLKIACVLSGVYSVPQGEGCYIYVEKKEK